MAVISPLWHIFSIFCLEKLVLGCQLLKFMVRSSFWTQKLDPKLCILVTWAENRFSKKCATILNHVSVTQPVYLYIYMSAREIKMENKPWLSAEIIKLIKLRNKSICQKKRQPNNENCKGI